MKIHLVTVVGDDLTLLPHMLNHYRRAGIESFIINVHAKTKSDPLLEEARRVAADFGLEISAVVVGEWSDALNSRLYAESKKYPEDWYVMADLDEFHRYPGGLSELIAECERKGYDYIEGCLIDRIAADGGLQEVTRDRSIEDQFPLGCVLTYAILQGYPMEVVAAKGWVRLSGANHYALNGKGCPVDDCLVQVHHYKWVKGLVGRLKRRQASDRGLLTDLYRQECARFIEYFYANNGRIDIADPRLLAAECTQDYRYWPLIVEAVKSNPNRPGAHASAGALN